MNCFGCESLPLRGPPSEEQSELVTSVAAPQIEDLRRRLFTPDNEMPLFFDRLKIEILFGAISDYLFPEDLKALCVLNKNMKAVLGDEKFLPMWSSLYKRRQQDYNVRDLDELGAGPLLGITATSKESIQSLKRRIQLLASVRLVAKLSEDGGATIVTIPAEWTIEKLEKLSKKAVEEMNIPSAEIFFGRTSCRTILKQHPTGEAQTIVLTNTVIGDRSAAAGSVASSRMKTVEQQKAQLASHGIEEFPDALTVLTAAVLTRIITQGKSSLYSQTDTDVPSIWTRTKQKTSAWHLCLVSAPSHVKVEFYFFPDFRLGVGASGSFKDIGAWSIGT